MAGYSQNLLSRWRSFHAVREGTRSLGEGSGTFDDPWVINMSACWNQWVWPGCYRVDGETLVGFIGADTYGYVGRFETNKQPRVLRLWDQGNFDDHNGLSFLPIERAGTDDFYIFGAPHQTNARMRYGYGSGLDSLTQDDFTVSDFITYSQPVRYLDRIMCLTRLKWATAATDPRDWVVVESTDNGANWAERTVFAPNTLDTSTPEHGYVLWKAAPSNTLNIAFYENAANGEANSVWVGYADLTDGTLYNLSDTDNGDIYSSTTPIRPHQDLTEVYDPASGSTNLRLWDIHNDERDFLTAEGTNQNNGDYRYHWVSGASATSETLVATGDVISEDGGNRYYHCGGAIVSSGKVVIARESSGTYYLDLMESTGAGNGWTTTNLRTSTSKMFRPMIEQGAGGSPRVAWLEGGYEGYGISPDFGWTSRVHVADLP